ncbi:MAG: HNH endonuclease family protein [Coriobacteriia bacterium]|nr:HNH endonuclease family protein [Coriobacteriia bacterium]
MQQYILREGNFSIDNIVNRINLMRSITQEDDNYYWGHWGESRLRDSIQHSVSGASARFILWRYENYLRKENNKEGYGFQKFEDILSPELEHIAPQTPKAGDSIAAGYPKYDECFVENHLDSLGNYLLLSKSHNGGIGNDPFPDKRATYTSLEQQREIQELTKDHPDKWTLDNIKSRTKVLIDFVVSEL